METITVPEKAEDSTDEVKIAHHYVVSDLLLLKAHGTPAVASCGNVLTEVTRKPGELPQKYCDKWLDIASFREDLRRL